MLKERKLIILLLAAAVLVVGLAATTRPAKAADGAKDCVQYYWAWYGDTLSSIGARFGVDYRYLAKINGIKNPRVLYAGQVLCIPAYGSGYGAGGPYYYNTYGYGGPYYYNYGYYYNNNYGYGGPYYYNGYNYNYGNYYNGQACTYNWKNGKWKCK
jgi:LysM repeat protein